MSQLIAILFLLTTSFLISVGNFWFTYGIWPRSWWAFVIFWILNLVNYALLTAVSKGK